MKQVNPEIFDGNGLAEQVAISVLVDEEQMSSDFNGQINLLVVDDDPLVRKAIVMCLAHCKNINVIGELGDPRNIVARAQELRPDVVLMDVGMPEMSGLAATCLLHENLPEVKVLILSIHESASHLRQAMAAGALGYALKGTSVGELARAIEMVYRGEMYFSPEMMRLTVEQFVKGEQSTNKSRLTEREREVLVLVADGWSNKETAAELGVSVRTVETHRENLMRKLGIHSAAGLARFAVANGFVPATACT